MEEVASDRGRKRRPRKEQASLDEESSPEQLFEVLSGREKELGAPLGCSLRVLGRGESERRGIVLAVIVRAKRRRKALE